MLFNMLQYMAPQDYVIATAKNKLHSMIVVGGMGSGKTTWTLSLIARGIEELLNRGKDDDEIIVIHALETNMTKAIKEITTSVDLKRIKYMYWFSDDAPATEGMHSRRSMSQENVSESKFYTVIRHRLERRGFDGFIFVAHATQIYSLIDITFRRLAKIKAFKDYPDEPSDLKIIGPMLGKIYLKKLAETSYKIWSPRSREELVEGLSTAIVRFIRRKKAIKVSRREIPGSVNTLYIEPDYADDGNMETGKPVEYKILASGLKPVIRGNTLYVYKRDNGNLLPLLKVKWKN